MQTMRVKPAEGMKVRDPLSRQHLPAEGAEVACSQYWFRRIRSGEVVEIVAPAVAPSSAPVVQEDPIPDSRLQLPTED